MKQIQTVRYNVKALLAALPSPVRVLSRGSARDEEAVIRTLTDDSRRAVEDSLFVCVRGEVSDGHDYIRAAFETGCRSFLVDASYEGPLPDGAWVFATPDTRASLPRLAAAFYGKPAEEMRIVGITGTNGKTTSALFAYHILQKQGVRAGYIGTNGALFADRHYETKNTTPGPLELHSILADMRDAGIDTVVMEVSSQALRQDRVAGIPFAIAVFTNLSPDHIGAPEHPDFEDYKACKKRLLTDCDPGLVIANADDPATPEMLCGVTAPILLYGTGHADLVAEGIQPSRTSGIPAVHFCCTDGEQTLGVSLPYPGDYNVSNALCALSVTRALGIPLPCAAESLSTVRIPGRFETIPTSEGGWIVIDFAHNGASLTAVLQTLRALSPNRLFCLVGSVGGRTTLRRPELGRAARELADFSFFTADDPGREPVEEICAEIASVYLPGEEGERYRIIPDRADAIRAAVSLLEHGDILLVAGKGDERYQKIGDERIPYCDRDAVISALYAQRGASVLRKEK